MAWRERPGAGYARLIAGGRVDVDSIEIARELWPKLVAQLYNQALSVEIMQGEAPALTVEEAAEDLGFEGWGVDYLRGVKLGVRFRMVGGVAGVGCVTGLSVYDREHGTAGARTALRTVLGRLSPVHRCATLVRRLGVERSERFLCWDSARECWACQEESGPPVQFDFCPFCGVTLHLLEPDNAS